jgi:SpoIID/LytB domain protein
LTYNNELVDALYSSTTGGVTAAFEDVWEGDPQPYLQPVIDAVPNRVWDLKRRPLKDENNFRQFISLKQGFNEETWGYFRWRVKSPLKDLNRDLRAFLKQKQSPLAGFQTIQRLKIEERSPAGRVRTLSVQTNLGTVKLSKDEILRCFQAPNSLLFYLEPIYAADKVTLEGYSFVGGGLGHGVGLSQAGSYRLGDLGWSAPQIVNFYFPRTQLKTLNSSVVLWQDPKGLQAGAEAQFESVPFWKKWFSFL